MSNKSFMQNKSCAQVLNVEASNLVFSKSNNTEFEEVIMTFTDQMGGCWKQKIKLIWHCLLINGNDANSSLAMPKHSTAQRTRLTYHINNILKGMYFPHLQ